MSTFWVCVSLLFLPCTIRGAVDDFFDLKSFVRQFFVWRRTGVWLSYEQKTVVVSRSLTLRQLADICLGTDTRKK
jgi:hypothetical protein